MYCESIFLKLKLLEYFYKYWCPRSYFFPKRAFFSLKRIFFENVCIKRNKIHAILNRIGLNICRNDIILNDLWRFENSVQTFVHGPVHVDFIIGCKNFVSLLLLWVSWHLGYLMCSGGESNPRTPSQKAVC